MVIVDVADFVVIVIFRIIGVFYFSRSSSLQTRPRSKSRALNGKKIRVHLIQTTILKNNNQKNFDKTKIFTSNDSSLPTPMA